MARIAHVAPGFYRVPLPTVLTDSTHGEMRAFELCTVRVRDADGAEGVGYTFTVGRNGGAIARHPGARDARDPRRRGRRPDRAAVAEALVGAALWRPRRADRAGDLRHRHGALGPEGEARRHSRCGACWAATIRKVPCYAGGIDLDLPLDALLRQTDANLARGFRAIKMKVGRARLAEDVERVAAMRRHLGDGFPAHGGRQHEVERRPGDPRRPRLRSPMISPGSRSR